MKRKTIEFITMIGDRIMDSDGFTYPVGRAKACKKICFRWYYDSHYYDEDTGEYTIPWYKEINLNNVTKSETIKRQIRNDKRSVKAKENKRILNELDPELRELFNLKIE